MLIWLMPRCVHGYSQLKPCSYKLGAECKKNEEEQGRDFNTFGRPIPNSASTSAKETSQEVAQNDQERSDLFARFTSCAFKPFYSIKSTGS